MIKSWSHHREGNFRQCKFRAKLLYIDKLDEDKLRPPPKDPTAEQPFERGIRLHDLAEGYVRHGQELPADFASFRPEFEALSAKYKEGKVSLEGEWAHDLDWAPCSWHGDVAWLRLKIDALVFVEPTHALVIDYKTGKRSGNELKHAEQVQLYTLCTLLRYPAVDKVTTELWYTDIDDLARTEYTREQGIRFLKIWDKRGRAVTEEEDFPPNPNKFSCQWCYFGKKGSGVCTVGV